MLNENAPGVQARGRNPGARLRWFGLALIAALALAIPAIGFLLMGERKDPDTLWREGEAYLRSEQIERADAVADRLVRMRKPTPLDLMFLAQLDLAHDRGEDAVFKLRQIPDQHPMAAQAWLMIGRTELRQQRARLAEEALRKALQLDPKLEAAHRELIYILGYQLRRTELSAEFLALSRLTELGFDNMFHWCLMRTALWEPDTAIEQLRQFSEADPLDRWSRIALADNYRRMGQLDAAEETIAPLAGSDVDALAIRVMLAIDRHDHPRRELARLGPGR